MKGDLKIGNKVGVHCPTEELAVKVLTIAHDLGYTWSNNNPFLENINFRSYKEATTYRLFDGVYGPKSYFIDEFGENSVISAEEFIKLHTTLSGCLPEYWKIKLTSETRKIVGEYYDKQCNSDCYHDYSYTYLYSHNYDQKKSIMSDGQKRLTYSDSDYRNESIEITFEQFKKYVLKEHKMEITSKAKDLLEKYKFSLPIEVYEYLSSKKCEKLDPSVEAFKQLMEIYLRYPDSKKTWECDSEDKYCIEYRFVNDGFRVYDYNVHLTSIFVFSNKNIAEDFIRDNELLLKQYYRVK